MKLEDARVTLPERTYRRAPGRRAGAALMGKRRTSNKKLLAWGTLSKFDHGWMDETNAHLLLAEMWQGTMIPSPTGSAAQPRRPLCGRAVTGMSWLRVHPHRNGRVPCPDCAALVEDQVAVAEYLLAGGVLP